MLNILISGEKLPKKYRDHALINNKYFNKQILYVNNKTKTPDKMEIVDNEENPRFIVTYEGFKYNK